MRLEPQARAELIGKHVGPLFARAGISTQIFDWDHNWDQPSQPLTVLADSVARRYVSGVAWHCYATGREALRSGTSRSTRMAVRTWEAAAIVGLDGSKVLLVVNAAATDVSFAIRAGDLVIPYAIRAGAVVTIRWQ